MKQKLQEFAFGAEIISAIAIVASLIFVGVQIQQSYRINEVNAYQDLVSKIATLNLVRIENREFAELYGRYTKGEEITNQADLHQMAAFLATSFRYADLAYHQYINEIIDEQRLNSVLSPINYWKGQSFGETLWSDVSRTLDPEFVRYMNEFGHSNSADFEPFIKD